MKLSILLLALFGLSFSFDNLEKRVLAEIETMSKIAKSENGYLSTSDFEYQTLLLYR
jgi:hypothetical protein